MSEIIIIILGRSGERGSGISVLAARLDDDDDDDDDYIHNYFAFWKRLLISWMVHVSILKPLPFFYLSTQSKITWVDY